MEVLENQDAWHADYANGWLAHYNETGETLWKVYTHPRNKEAPAGKAIDLSQSRLVLISSAGGYLPKSQQPFDAENDLGDYTTRVIPSSTSLDSIAYAHTHYDHTAVNADPQVLVPLRHLDAMVDDGIIGELAPNMISFMGYQPDATRVIDETIPEILDAVNAMDAHAALLVPS